MSGQHIATLFPGQGVLDTNVFRQCQGASPETIAMFAEVDEVAREVCGTPLPRALGRRAPGASLDLMIFMASVGSYRSLVGAGLRPRAIVGHGFGEIAALVAADALSLRDGAELVARRYLALASQTTRSRMAALKLPAGHVRTFLRLLDDATVSIAAENARNESVIVGSPGGILAAEDLARLLGLSFKRLNTTCGPHRSCLGGIEQELLASLAHVAPRPPGTPVYSPLRGRFYRADDNVVACMAEQLAQPLRFADAVDGLVADGVTLFVEIGPLRGLRADLDCRAIADIQFLGHQLHDTDMRGPGSSPAAIELEVA